MENIPILYLVQVLLAGLLAVIAIWARRKIAPRVVAVLVLFSLVMVGYYSLINLLGRPQPYEHAFFKDVQEDAAVIAASIDEGEAIYLWLRIPGLRQPRYYRMAWDQQTATALKTAIDRSLRNNTSVQLNLQYEPSIEIRQMPQFYNLPIPSLPVKPAPEIFEYRNPDSPI